MPQTMKAHLAWAILAVKISLDLGGGCEWEAEGGMSHLECRSEKGRERCYALFLVTPGQWGQTGDLLALAHQAWSSGLSDVASTKAQIWSSERQFLLRVRKMVFCWLNGLALT